MAYKVIKKIDVWSLAKIYGLIMVVFSAIFAFLYGMGMILAALFGATSNLMIVAGIAVMIFAPLFYGLMGFLMGALAAVVYNFIAGAIGGLKIELE